MTHVRSRSRRLALATVASSAVVAAPVVEAPPAHADGCLARTWGQVCAWPHNVGNYLSYNDVERRPLGAGEIANQCDIQGISRTITKGGKEVIYESVIDAGCWPGGADLWQKAFTMRHYGRYKSVDRLEHIDSVCAGWREHAPDPNHDWFHFHGYGCWWT